MPIATAVITQGSMLLHIPNSTMLSLLSKITVKEIDSANKYSITRVLKRNRTTLIHQYSYLYYASLAPNRRSPFIKCH